MDDIVRAQIDYYRARAAEYDEWWFRHGRYDQGPERNAVWFQEVDEIERALLAADPRGHVLEIACGTGLWTQFLAPRARRMTALDAVGETIALNRARVKSANVDYLEADVFAWQPSARYDFIFFGFWISHIPRARWESFWSMIERAIAPDGTVFFVDNRPYAFHAEVSERRSHEGDTIDMRTLNDGREFAIVKNFFEPAALQAELARRGWSGYVRECAAFFIYGAVSRSDRAAA